jgi:hypothetical protein
MATDDSKPPADPEPFQLWWDPVSKKEFTWFISADGHGAWVEATPGLAIRILAEKHPRVTGSAGRAARGDPREPLWWTDAETALAAVPAHVNRANVSAVIVSMRAHWPHVEGSTDCPSDSTLRRFLKRRSK